MEEARQKSALFWRRRLQDDLGAQTLYPYLALSSLYRLASSKPSRLHKSSGLVWVARALCDADMRVKDMFNDVVFEQTGSFSSTNAGA